MKNKKLLIGVMVVILIGAFVVVAVAKKPKTEETIGGLKSGPRVTVERVKKDNIQTKISSSGKLEAENTCTIYAETPNTVVEVHKKAGDLVKKGDVILTLDTAAQVKTSKQIEALELKLKAAQDELNKLLGAGSKEEILSAQSAILNAEVDEQNTKDALDSKKTELENLRRDLKTSQLEYDVQKQSFEAGLASQKELDDAKNKLVRLEQDIESTEVAIAAHTKKLETIALNKEKAEYNLDVLLNKIDDSNKRQKISNQQATIKELQTQIFNSQTDLGKIDTQIVAPIDGVITQTIEDEGAPIVQGTVIVTIVDPSKLIVNCPISPYYAADLKVGLDATIKYTGSKIIEVQGKVSKVSPIALTQTAADKQATTTIPVEVQVLNPGEVIKPGFTVDVKIITETRENVCLVPLLATIEDDDQDKTYVYVVAEDGTLEKREVEQGLSNGLNIEVSNVKEGEMIVASPSDYLSEGMQVSYEKIGDVK
ncbi:hypothetical protein CS063_02970 [Sporanaerobium hydrogeniformans]|uniref:Uncharacterized protein n=1 Tax=Sporanaerobium hydrogeniformans TaxID=3072179 RepID=A0AC61DF60_9FIRM|nr:efflux RND transporter periplasmic adaptor subunit [Sporanaerobium hydrogeniformans]PHV71547.1 hypothetical protein CS063_02970 [Sporanaerobium hydrogeniformans]